MTEQSEKKPNQKYRDILNNEYINRKMRNPSYSLRAFAKSMGISSGALSQIISGKRPLTQKSAFKIANCLELSPKDREQFLSFLVYPYLHESSDIGYEPLSDDQFRLISDWYHYAILSLGEVENNQYNAKWIGKRLGISALEARDALRRLERLGLIKKVKSGFKQTSKPLTISRTVSTPAIRNYHIQNLKKAELAIQDLPTEKRQISSITMAVDKKNLQLAEEMIKDFRRKLSVMLSKGKPNAVYTCAIQLFPVSKEP